MQNTKLEQDSEPVQGELPNPTFDIDEESIIVDEDTGSYSFKILDKKLTNADKKALEGRYLVESITPNPDGETVRVVYTKIEEN